MLNPQLNTFIQVAENGSFSKAAEKLYITPSAVIQQINNLEKELQVSLFIRTRHGTQLTPAGEYLFQQAGSLLQTCREIEENLITLHRRRQRKITVGTSLLMKCRVFYPLWARFQKAVNDQIDVEILDLSLNKEAYKADLLEGIYDGEAWQLDRQFLPLFKVPIACAVARNHPLANKSCLTFEDMRPYTLVTIRSNMSEELDRLQQEAKVQGIRVVEVKRYDLSIFSRCIIHQDLLQTPLCWKDIHPDLITLPCAWNYSLAYGFHYEQEPNSAVREFMDFVRRIKETETLHL